MPKAAGSLLEGNIRKQLIGLTLPLFAGEILQQLYNTADSLIIGKYLGTEAFAASGIAGSVMNLFIFILTGFCVGVTVIFSREFGAGNLTEYRKAVFTAIVFGAGFAVIISIVFIALTGPVLRLVATPENLIGLCRTYLVIILGGLIATYFNNLLTGILRSIGATGVSLLFLTGSIVTNVLLDLLLIAVIPMGIGGAAAATVLAQALSALACLIYLKKRWPQLLCGKADAGWYPQLLRQIFGYGSSTALQMSSLYIGKLVVQGIVDTCGTAVIAAFTAATRIEAFINAPGNGFANAESIFLSQNRGAGNPERVRRGVRESFLLIISTGLVLSAIMYAVSPSVLRLFLDPSETESMAAGIAYLRLIFFFYLLSYSGYFFVGVSRGFGKMSVPVLATTIQITVRVILSALLIRRLGLSAVAWATGIGWVFVVGFHALRYRSYGSAELRRLEGKKAGVPAGPGPSDPG